VTAARRALRGLRIAAERARFRAWTLHLDIALRRRGGRLILDAPHGIELEGSPSVRAVARGVGAGTFTLRAGRDVRIGRGVRLEVWAAGTNRLELGDDAYVLDGAVLSLRSGAITLGPKANVREYAMLKSSGLLELGEHVAVSNFSVLHCTRSIELRAFASTAERVTIIDSEKSHDGSDTFVLNQPLKVDPVVVEENVFIAANVVITMGTRVRKNSVVGAGSVLTGGEYPAGQLIAGVPARPIRPLAAAERDQAEESSSR
jgi:acetyltransferase-like isoleucine patch superfamily enzyme